MHYFNQETNISYIFVTFLSVFVLYVNCKNSTRYVIPCVVPNNNSFQPKTNIDDDIHPLKWINNFRESTWNSVFPKNSSSEVHRYVCSLLVQIAAKDNNRTKRQTHFQPSMRVRPEVRTLSPNQWNTFTSAINRLKRQVCLI